MKFLLLSLLFASKLWANDMSDLPTGICDDGRCSSYQEKIIKKFMAGSILNITSPSVYSGKCYHLDNNFDGKFAHYGVAYINGKDGELFWGGAFAFFEETNPYKNMSVEEAIKSFGAVEENPNAQLFKLDNFNFSVFGDDEKAYRYWFRKDAKTSQIEILAYWGINHRMTCEMQLNKK